MRHKAVAYSEIVNDELFPQRVEKPTADIFSPTYYNGRGPRRRLTTFIVPPADFSLRRDYDRVASFFSHFRDFAYNKSSTNSAPFGIDFSALRKISPGAALVLAAEL
jgi:hypothetical protein